MKISKQTIIRTAVLALALVNTVLEMTGHSILPIDDEMLSELISLLFLAASSVWAWWKNNSFTENAVKADEYLNDLKESEEVR